MVDRFTEEGLIPFSNKPIELHFDYLEWIVNNFCFNEHRQVLWQEYMLYTNLLYKVLKRPFIQWMDGSFLTKKANPNDIDILNWVVKSDFENLEPDVKKNFGRFANRIFSKRVDDYLLFQANDSDRLSMERETLDEAQWHQDFTTHFQKPENSRMAAKETKRSKGYVIIKVL